jgi:hypothetical protein
VPLVGELMASRWAFEASMVAQFKSNEYAEPFYELDQQMAESEYKTVYYIPRLKSKVNFLKKNLENRDSDEFAEAIKILKNEIGLELEIVGQDKFDVYHKLTAEKFDKWTADKTEVFLNTLARFYNNYFNQANAKKEKAIYMLTSSPDKKKRFEYLRDNYFNKTVANLVKNTNDPNRILEYDGRLIQKIYPVYMEPQPKHTLDFRTQFYAGEKHFAGFIFNTLSFNLAVIWLMSIFLYFTLYFDIIRKLVSVKWPFK